MIIGITGPICAGKNEVSDILRNEHRYVALSFGKEVGLELFARREDKTRQNAQNLGAQRKKEISIDYWARRLIGRMEEGEKYVVDGFRSIEEVLAFRELTGFKLLGVTADYEIRLRRYLDRARPGDVLTREDFQRADAFDTGADGSGNSESALVYKMKDLEIINDRDTLYLRSELRRVLDSLRQKS